MTLKNPLTRLAAWTLTPLTVALDAASDGRALPAARVSPMSRAQSKRIMQIFRLSG